MLTVYILDDADALRERLAELVTDIPGFEVIGQNKSPFEGIKDIETRQPDIVILDIRLPGKSGIDVLKDIKRNMPAITVIMITNYPYRQYRQGCIKAGADYFFSKIDEFDRIRETLIRIALNQKQKGQNKGRPLKDRLQEPSKSS